MEKCFEITEPQIDERADLPYAAIWARATQAELPALIPQLHSELVRWLKLRGMHPAGRSFVRYLVLYPNDTLELEMGWPVDRAVVGDDRVSTGVLPAGCYASVQLNGDYAGLYEAHRTLIDWARDNDIEWDEWHIGLGAAFSARYETYLVDPGDVPDPDQWQTEVAIRLADE